MRVFSAIFPPDEIVDDLSQAVTPLLRHYPELAWSPPPLWHLTLTYFGNLSLNDTGQLDGVMRSFVMGRRPITLRLDGAGATPEPSAADELYMQVTSVDNALVKLYLDGVEAVKNRGWILDRRSFRSRVPIARTETSMNMAGLIKELGDYQSPEWQADSVAILWSRPGTDGRPYYQLLGEHTFR